MADTALMERSPDTLRLALEAIADLGSLKDKPAEGLALAVVIAQMELASTVGECCGVIDRAVDALRNDEPLPNNASGLDASLLDMIRRLVWFVEDDQGAWENFREDVLDGEDPKEQILWVALALGHLLLGTEAPESDNRIQSILTEAGGRNDRCDS